MFLFMSWMVPVPPDRSVVCTLLSSILGAQLPVPYFWLFSAPLTALCSEWAQSIHPQGTLYSHIYKPYYSTLLFHLQPWQMPDTILHHMNTPHIHLPFHGLTLPVILEHLISLQSWLYTIFSTILAPAQIRKLRPFYGLLTTFILSGWCHHL